MKGTHKSYDHYQRLFDAESLDPAGVLQQVNNSRNELNRYLEQSIFYASHEEEIPENIKNQLKTRLAAITEYFLPHFIKADLLAIRYQSLYRKASLAIYSLAAFAVIIIAAQYIFHLPHFLIVGEIIAMIAVVGIIGVGNFIGWHRRWLDYRFLAERIRAAIFLSFAAEELKEDNTGWPMSMAYDSWAMMYFKNLRSSLPQTEAVAEVSLPVIKHFIQHAWLADQSKFHQSKSLREHRSHTLISRAGELFYGLTLIAAILHFFHIGNAFMGNVWTFLAISFPATGSAFSALRSHFEFKKNADRSNKVSRSLEYFMEQLAPIKETKKFHMLLNNIDTLVLQENIDWHATIASHQLETPA